MDIYRGQNANLNFKNLWKFFLKKWSKINIISNVFNNIFGTHFIIS